jgi:selenide,water dikinase
MAALGLIPGGAYRNLEYYRKDLILEGEDNRLQDLLIFLADPQTSGGLLISVSPERLERLLTELHEQGSQGKVIGKIIANPAGKIIIF